jgi:hypothetical protein
LTISYRLISIFTSHISINIYSGAGMISFFCFICYLIFHDFYLLIMMIKILDVLIVHIILISWDIFVSSSFKLFFHRLICVWLSVIIIFTYKFLFQFLISFLNNKFFQWNIAFLEISLGWISRIKRFVIFLIFLKLNFRIKFRSILFQRTLNIFN